MVIPCAIRSATAAKFVDIPQPKPMHRFSPNFQDMLTETGPRADEVLGVSGNSCFHVNT